MMKQITNFLAGDEAIKKGLILFLGPLFLIVSLILAGSLALWTAVFFGLFLIWKMPRIGIILALSMELLISFYLHSKTSHQLWQTGLEITIALGLVITHYSCSLFQHLVDALEKKGEEKEKELLSLQEEVKKKSLLFQQEKEHFQNYSANLENIQKELEDKLSMAFVFTDTLQSKIDEDTEASLELQKLRSSYIALKEEQESLKDVEAIKKNNLDLIQKLNQVRVEKFQVHLINEALAKFLGKETVKKASIVEELQKLQTELAAMTGKEEELQKIIDANNQLQKELLILESKFNEIKSEKELLQEELSKEKQISHTQYLSETNSLKNEIHLLREKIEEKNLLLQSNDKGLSEARKAEHSYIELRKQFEEKSQLLHQTRGELFAMETHFLALQKEIEDSKLDSYDLSFVNYLNDLEQIDEEVKELRQIISGLLSQEKPKTTRKKASSKDQLPLV